jgi:hypothetical protein
MDKRINEFFELAVKRLIELNKRKDFASANKFMQQANLPVHVIERVLYEPYNIRRTDRENIKDTK